MRERVVLLILCIGRRCGVVSFPLDIHLFSLIFPFPKGKTSEYRSNNEWINDDAWRSPRINNRKPLKIHDNFDL